MPVSLPMMKHFPCGKCKGAFHCETQPPQQCVHWQEDKNMHMQSPCQEVEIHDPVVISLCAKVWNNFSLKSTFSL